MGFSRGSCPATKDRVPHISLVFLRDVGLTNVALRLLIAGEEFRGESSGIRHLAKNERDTPNFLQVDETRSACAPFFKERRMKFREPTKPHRKSGIWGTQARGWETLRTKPQLWQGKKYDSPCVDALSARTYNHCWPCDYLDPCLFFAFAARCAGRVTAMQMRLRETRKRRPAFR
jgi:hypothetical protein